MPYFEKNSEVLLFGSLAQTSENMQKQTFLNSPLKIRKFCPLWRLLFPKKDDIFNFLSVKYFGKRLSFPKIWHVWVKYCWNYGPSNLLFRFTQHILQRPKNRQMKKTINSLIYLIGNYYRKKCLVKVWSFLTHWLENDGPSKFLRNWTEKTFYQQFLASLEMIKVVF